MAHAGFIGLGSIGTPIATNILNSGHSLVVFDLDTEACSRLEERGASVAENPADVAATVDVIFLSLPTPDAVEDVVFGTNGIEQAASEESMIVDTTTSNPETTRKIAEKLEPAGVTVLSAPVSGGVSGAEQGTLTTMVGGNETAYKSCHPFFETYASDIFHVGPSPEDGHVMKLLNNYLSFLNLIGASEAVSLGTQAGLEAEQIVEIINQSSGRNAATEKKFPEEILTGDFNTGFALSLMHKDIQLFREFADAHGTPILVGDTIKNLIGYADVDLEDDADITQIYSYISEKTNQTEN